MSSKLALLLKSRLVLVVVGTLLVAAVGATVALAATGAWAHQPLASQTPSPASQCASNDDGGGHTSSQKNDDRDETSDQSENQHALEGTITSLDTAGSSFVLTQCDGTTKTVEVSAKTKFGELVRSFAELKVGLFVDVEGSVQSNGTLTASSVHVANNASGDDHDTSGGGDHGGSGTSTPAARSND